MPIKNYTSSVDPFVSIGEIQSALANAGAAKIMIDYNDGDPVAVSFMLHTQMGDRGFSLPAPVDGTLRAFAKQRVKGADKQQARRTAWRNVRDWILAQCALVESCDVPVDQVFLPYLTDNTGRTLYEVYSAGQLLVGSGGAAEALMRGDCTACGAYQPDGPYPYQCELQGKISEGGCELWHPKGVLENDTD